MFYSKFMFVKKGPLAKVWLAAHFHRKLNKQMVQGTDINLSCKSILEPQAPLALRLTGQLLLGLVRIYQKKVKYLQEDCSDALTKMKSVFRAGAVDLPPESAVAAAGTITHPDNYDEIEYAIPDIPMENFDDMMADMIPEGRAASSLGGPRLDDYSTDTKAITLDEQEDGFQIHDGLLDHDDDLMPPFMNDDEVELPRSEDVEGGFDVQTPGGQPDDLTSDAASTRSRRTSVLPQNMSEFDSTTDAEQDADKASVASEKTKAAAREPSTPIPDVTPHIVEVEKKAKPKRKLRRDEKTELPSALISEAIKDTSDIRFVEGRPSIPFTKRAKFRDVVQKTNLAQLMKQPSAFGAISAGTAESELPIAPELWGIVEQAEAFAQTREKPAEESRREREEEPVVEEDVVPKEEEEEKIPEEEREFDIGDMDQPEFAIRPDEMGSLMDDSTTVVEQSIAETPAAQRELPEDEDNTGSTSYRDDPEHFREELNEFFGEDKPKKRGKKGAAEAEEEEVAALGWGHRTDKTHQVLAKEMKGKTSLSFDTLMAGRSRTVAAGVFYQLLVLKSHSIIQVAQKAPYENIVISELKRTARAS